jgi:hypothetical protein
MDPPFFLICAAPQKTVAVYRMAVYRYQIQIQKTVAVYRMAVYRMDPINSGCLPYGSKQWLSTVWIQKQWLSTVWIQTVAVYRMAAIYMHCCQFLVFFSLHHP